MFAFLLNMWIRRKVTSADLQKMVERQPPFISQDEYKKIVSLPQE